MQSFQNIAIVGSSGSIGQAFVDHFTEDTHCKTLFALSRNKPTKILDPKTQHLQLDLTDPSTIQKAFESIKTQSKLDLVLVTTGILHSDSMKPEKSITHLNLENLQQNFAINTFGPALVAKHALPLLNRTTPSILAILSARVGSISDNRLGGWHSYRASKAALNMLIKNAALEYKWRNPNASIIGLHPGTVDSALSKPFQKNVADNKLFSPAFSVQKLLNVLQNCHSSDSGKIFAWDGQEIPA